MQERSRQTRDKVLDAARALILERGHEQVSLKDICDRSGVSNGSIFHHFGSKEGVLRELFAQERSAYLRSISTAIMAHGGDPCDAFAEGTRAAMRYKAENPVRYERLMAEFTDSQWLRENVELWNEVAAAEEKLITDWAESHLKSGDLPDLPTAFLHAAALGSTELLSRLHRRGALPGTLDEHGEELVEFVSAGLKRLRELQRDKGREAA